MLVLEDDCDQHFYSANLHVDIYDQMGFTSSIMHTYIIYLSSDYLSLQQLCFLLTVFITHAVNFPCGRKPEHSEKTHDFRQSVDWLFSHESVARIKPTISEVKIYIYYRWAALPYDKYDYLIFLCSTRFTPNFHSQKVIVHSIKKCWR
jgi:hypothetical protein